MADVRCRDSEEHQAVWTCACSHPGSFCSPCLLNHLSVRPGDSLHSVSPLGPVAAHMCGLCHTHSTNPLKCRYPICLCRACVQRYSLAEELPEVSHVLQDYRPSEVRREIQMPVRPPPRSPLQRLLFDKRNDIEEQVRRVLTNLNSFDDILANSLELEERLKEAEARLEDSRQEVLRLSSRPVEDLRRAEGDSLARIHSLLEDMQTHTADTNRENGRLTAQNEILASTVSDLTQRLEAAEKRLKDQETLSNQLAALEARIAAISDPTPDLGVLQKATEGLADEELFKKVQFLIEEAAKAPTDSVSRDLTQKVKQLQWEVSAFCSATDSEVRLQQFANLLRKEMMRTAKKVSSVAPLVDIGADTLWIEQQSADEFFRLASQGVKSSIKAVDMRKISRVCIRIAEFLGHSQWVGALANALKKQLKVNPERGLRDITLLEAVHFSMKEEDAATGAIEGLLRVLKHDVCLFEDSINILARIQPHLTPLSPFAVSLSAYFESTSEHRETWRQSLLALPLEWDEQYHDVASHSIRTFLKTASEQKFEVTYLQLAGLLISLQVSDPSAFLEFFTAASLGLNDEAVREAFRELVGQVLALQHCTPTQQLTDTAFSLLSSLIGSDPGDLFTLQVMLRALEQEQYLAAAALLCKCLEALKNHEVAFLFGWAAVRWLLPGNQPRPRLASAQHLLTVFENHALSESVREVTELLQQLAKQPSEAVEAAFLAALEHSSFAVACQFSLSLVTQLEPNTQRFELLVRELVDLMREAEWEAFAVELLSCREREAASLLRLLAQNTEAFVDAVSITSRFRTQLEISELKAFAAATAEFFAGHSDCQSSWRQLLLQLSSVWNARYEATHSQYLSTFLRSISTFEPKYQTLAEILIAVQLPDPVPCFAFLTEIAQELAGKAASEYNALLTSVLSLVRNASHHEAVIPFIFSLLSALMRESAATREKLTALVAGMNDEKCHRPVQRFDSLLRKLPTQHAPAFARTVLAWLLSRNQRSFDTASEMLAVMENGPVEERTAHITPLLQGLAKRPSECIEVGFLLIQRISFEAACELCYLLQTQLIADEELDPLWRSLFELIERHGQGWIALAKDFICSKEREELLRFLKCYAAVKQTGSSLLADATEFRELLTSLKSEGDREASKAFLEAICAVLTTENRDSGLKVLQCYAAMKNIRVPLSTAADNLRLILLPLEQESESAKDLIESIYTVLTTEGCNYTVALRVLDMCAAHRRTLKGDLSSFSFAIAMLQRVLDDEAVPEAPRLLHAIEAALKSPSGCSTAFTLGCLYLTIPGEASPALEWLLEAIESTQAVADSVRMTLEALIEESKRFLTPGETALYVCVAKKLCASEDCYQETLPLIMDRAPHLLKTLPSLGFELAEDCVDISCRHSNQQTDEVLLVLASLISYSKEHGYEVGRLDNSLKDSFSERCDDIRALVTALKTVVEKQSAAAVLVDSALSELPQIDSKAVGVLCFVTNLVTDLTEAGVSPDIAIEMSTEAARALQSKRAEAALSRIQSQWSQELVGKIAAAVEREQGQPSLLKIGLCVLQPVVAKLANVQARCVRFFNFEHKAWDTTVSLEREIQADVNSNFVFLNDDQIFCCGGSVQKEGLAIFKKWGTLYS